MRTPSVARATSRGTAICWHVACALAMVVGAVEPAGAATLSLSARAIKSEVLAGEPVVLQVTISGDVPVVLPPHLTEPHLLRVVVNRGAGWVQYREKKWVSTPTPDPDLPTNGREVLEYVLAYDANTSDWVFPVPGEYAVAVEYAHPQLGVRRSNAVAITVRAPKGDETIVHDALRRLGPEQLGVHAPNGFEPAMADLVARYPASAYLQKERVNDVDWRRGEIHNGYDPDEPLPDLDEPLRKPDVSADTVRTREADLVRRADGIASVPGPFQPIGLYQAGILYRNLGEEGMAQALFGRIVREFGDRAIAAAAREELVDTDPPRVFVSVTPATLWPPNNKLVAVLARVEVTDDTDQSPAVKLVSIACDDACDPARDIAGALLGTFDTAYELRATRTGVGAGRTYVITYAATDSSGNEASTQARVTVSHDQGR